VADGDVELARHERVEQHWVRRRQLTPAQRRKNPIRRERVNRHGRGTPHSPGQAVPPTAAFQALGGGEASVDAQAVWCAEHAAAGEFG